MKCEKEITMITIDEVLYKELCEQFGLKREWLGKTFEDKGTTYTIVGLNPRSKRYPVKTTFGNGQNATWNATYVAGRMGGNLAELRKAEQAKQREEDRANYKRLASLFGLKPEWLDQQFTFKTRTMTVVGLAPNRRRFPVVAADEHGKISLFTKNVLTEAFIKVGA
jgi:hypothetical protein